MLNTKVRFTDSHREFTAKSALASDIALAHMAQDIEIIIKTSGKTPFRKGALRNETNHEKLKALSYRVNVPVEYAAVQEMGRRGNSKPFESYTTPGTGAHFFASAVDTTITKVDNYIKEGKQLARIGA